MTSPQAPTLPALADAQKRLAPDEYRKLMDRTDLRHVSLRSVALKTAPLPPGTGRIHLTQRRRKATVEDHDSQTPSVVVEYQLTGKVGRVSVMDLRATYAIGLKAADPWPLDALAIYCHLNADMIAWPFLRELAYSLTTRTSLPPLTLPFRHHPTAASSARDE